jgi:hypothetical protein
MQDKDFGINYNAMHKATRRPVVLEQLKESNVHKVLNLLGAGNFTPFNEGNLFFLKDSKEKAEVVMSFKDCLIFTDHQKEGDSIVAKAFLVTREEAFRDYVMFFELEKYFDKLNSVDAVTLSAEFNNKYT